MPISARLAAKLALRAKLAAKFALRDLTSIEAMEDPPWLVAGYLPTQALALLYGAPGSFKSFLALDWALSLAYGLPWLDCATRPCPAIYIAAEGTHGIKRRVQAWHLEHGVESRMAPFYAVTCPVILAVADQKDTLVHVIRQADTSPGLIVLDTLARCFAGNENATEDMNAFVAACDALRAEWPASTLLVVHHTGKDEGRGARGSIALLGATDTALLLQNRNGNLIELHNPRQKDSEEREPRMLEFASQGPSLVCRASTVPVAKPGKAASKNGELLWKTLLHLQIDTGRGVRAQAWEDACGLPESTFKRHRRELMDMGRVLRLEDGTYQVVEED